MSEEKDIMNTVEAAEYLGVSTATLKNWVKDGVLQPAEPRNPLLKRPRAYHFKRDDLDRLRAQAQPTIYTQTQPHALLCEDRAEYNAGDEHPGA